MKIPRLLLLFLAFCGAWSTSAFAAAAEQQPERATAAHSRIVLERFDIVHTPRAAGPAVLLARSLERERSELARRLGRDYEGRTEVRVGEGIDELRSLAPPGGRPPVWAGGVAYPHLNVLLFDGAALRRDDARQIVLHELAHLALGRMGRGDWPRWFQEGFAMLVAGEWSVSRYTAMYRATVGDAAIPLSALTDGWPERHAEAEIAYALSLSFVSHVYEKGGDAQFRDFIGQVADGGGFEETFESIYGVALEAEESDWRSSLATRYTWLPLLTGTGTLWGLITVLFLIAYARSRRRKRERIRLMEIEEKAREEALRLAAEQLRLAESASVLAPLADPFDEDLDESDRTEDSGPSSRGGPTIH